MKRAILVACLLLVGCSKPPPSPPTHDDVAELKRQIAKALATKVTIQNGIVVARANGDSLTGYAAFPAASAIWRVECDFTGITVRIAGYEIELTDDFIHEKHVTCPKLLPFAVAQVAQRMRPRQ